MRPLDLEKLHGAVVDQFTAELTRNGIEPQAAPSVLWTSFEKPRPGIAASILWGPGDVEEVPPDHFPWSFGVKVARRVRVRIGGLN